MEAPGVVRARCGWSVRPNRAPQNKNRREARGQTAGPKEVIEPSWQDSLNSARCYTTAKRLLADEQANALSMDCLGMVAAKLVPTPPCGAWTLLRDQGITAGCEADLFGAMSLMLTSYRLDRPSYVNNPVPETANDQSLSAGGQVEYALRLPAKGAQEMTFRVACPGSSVPVPERMAWTPEKLRQSAAQVWREWKEAR
jgi:L-fucose isomerase-like protein